MTQTSQPAPGANAQPRLIDYSVVFTASPDGILVVDECGVIQDTNPELERLFGYDPDELRGLKIEVLVPETFRSGHERKRDGFTSKPRNRPMGVGLELAGRRKDGVTIPVEISLSPWQADEGGFVICTVRDITERKRLRAFTAGAVKAAEEERLRIARELHDDTAQRLAALIIQLKLALDAERPDDRERMCGHVLEELRETAESVRRIARGLRPPALEDAGVVTALQAHLRATVEHLDLTSALDFEAVDHLLHRDAKLVLYRVVQEALSNVIRHAEASHVSIQIDADQNVVRAIVEDDGIGFDPETVDGQRGLGLIGMKERVGGVGGSVTIESAATGGCRVLLSIPVVGAEIDDE
ncbi:MAG: hypothetical protein BMS9Abin29_2099 [Gemmatimonadota bacterium]|nr:MAG: hypothetical protein BMS9Abin29_2099 [Gemmatimonadota bacterium]